MHMVRVVVYCVWNGIPMMSPDIGDAGSHPMEQASQIEIMKGSSVLYGSGALNVIALTEKEPNLGD